jgi:hypothetical protein
MSRMLLHAGVLGLCLLSAGWAGEERGKATDTKRVALEDELRALLKDHGPTHPAVLALQERIARLDADAARGEEICPKRLLVVLAKAQVGATLKGARLRTLGGRSFVVGTVVEGPNITRATFLGKVVWIPVDDVTQLIEVEEEKGK